MELRVGNRYRLGRKIGSGSFGDIYLGEEGGSPGTCLGDLWRASGAGPGWALVALLPVLTARRDELGATPGSSFHPRKSSGYAGVLRNVL